MVLFILAAGYLIDTVTVAAKPVVEVSTIQKQAIDDAQQAVLKNKGKRLFEETIDSEYQIAYDDEYGLCHQQFLKGIKKAQTEWKTHKECSLESKFEHAGYQYEIAILKKTEVNKLDNQSEKHSTWQIIKKTETLSKNNQYQQDVKYTTKEPNIAQQIRPKILEKDLTKKQETASQAFPKVAVNLDHLSFINQFAKQAAQVAAQNDLFASVMIAQAALESSWGTSELAQKPNYNLFGVKGGYKGQSVNMKTEEDAGDGKCTEIQDDFRRYPNYRASLNDYATVLAQDQFKPAKKSQCQNYQACTKFLTGRYATDTNYNLKLNQIIESYNLTQYDQSVITIDTKVPRQHHSSEKSIAKRSIKKSKPTSNNSITWTEIIICAALMFGLVVFVRKRCHAI
jgi:flagellum-specific peptidoglycan hydrolase FlgJ